LSEPWQRPTPALWQERQQEEDQGEEEEQEEGKEEEGTQ
jgi:hypothetical protein